MMTCAAAAVLAACQPQTDAPATTAEETAPQAPVDGEDSKPSEIVEAEAGTFSVDTPAPGAKVTSPLVITASPTTACISKVFSRSS
jgi:hypothetical protein